MRFFYIFIFNFLIFNVLAAPKPSIKFIKNEGQWAASIRFKADIAGGYLLVKTNSIQYVFHDTKALSELHFGGVAIENARVSPQKIKSHAYEMSFVESNPESRIEGKNLQTATNNYFIGNDPSKWKSGVKIYDEIYIQNIYEGIDFRLHSFEQNLKYEYIVKPNADASKIRMKYDGLDELTIDNQQLNYKTSVNLVKEFEPYSFQEKNGKTTEIKSNFRLSNNQVQFHFPDDYDHSKPLIIDPELVFSTYSGSRADNWSQTATYDADGNLYAGGIVFGSNFPVTNGSFQTTVGGVQQSDPFGAIAVTDIVIMKFSADGTRLLYSTFLGGAVSEVAHSLIVNSKGELVIFGTTSSRNFPTTNTGFQRTFGGGNSVSTDPITTQIGMINGTDIFVSVLSKDGRQLLGSTYVGGSANDGINDTRNLDIRNYGDEFRGEVFVDKNDNIYFCSVTNSTNFPLRNAFQNVKSNSQDAVVCRLSTYCSDLTWSSYLGGNGIDNATGIRVTEQDEIYVCGATTSTNLATRNGALNRNNLGKSDGYVAKYVNNSLEQLTYLGTNQSDLASLIDIDKAGDVYVLGLTLGTYPINGLVYNKANSGQYIHCLDKNLSKTNFSLPFGAGRAGKIEIVPTAFLVNDCGNIYVSGWGGKVNFSSAARTYNEHSTTTGLPVTEDAIQKTTTGNNFYFMIMEAGAKSLLYATFFGGNPSDFKDPSTERGDHVDGGTCRFDKNGIIYHSACSCRDGDALSFPLKNAYSSAHNSNNCNLAAFKIDLGALKADFNISDGNITNPTELCAPARLSFDNKSTGAKTYEWELNGDVVSRLKDFTATIPNAGQYTMKLRIYNKITCKLVDSTERKFNIRSFNSSASGDTTICSDASVQLRATGGDRYTWSPSTGLNSTNIANPIAKVATTTKYSVIIEKEGCRVVRDVNIKVDNSKTDFIASPDKEICRGQSVLLGVTGKAIKTTWSRPNLPDTVATFITVKPSQTTTYTVRGEYSDGCKPQKSITVTIDETHKPDFDYIIQQECNKPFELIFVNNTKNASKFVWGMGNGDSVRTDVPTKYIYQKPGNYQIILKAYNKIGCELSTTKPINIPEADGAVPNVITPNNDGKNDFFVVGYLEPMLTIYNRYGKEVFKTEKYQNDWGTGIKTGTYYFLMKLNDGSECKGFIEVIN